MILSLVLLVGKIDKRKVEEVVEWYGVKERKAGDKKERRRG